MTETDVTNFSLYRTVLFPILCMMSTGEHERAHTIAKRAMTGMQRVPPLLALIAWYCQANEYTRPVDFCGVRLRSPVGFAAALDKNADFPLFLQACGFGFGVIGTVLPYAQAGNPRPRVFRLTEEEALINRLGFNSEGIESVRRELLCDAPRFTIPIGLSLGKMKETPVEEAYLDYINVLESAPPCTAFKVVNVSSPNTPGLRALQGKRYIEDLIGHIVHAEANAAQREGRPPQPILVKIAPDLSFAEADDAMEGSLAGGASGLVIGNTTTDRPLANESRYSSEIGGLSGKPLFPKMMHLAQYVRSRLPNVPLMLGGGIDSGERANKALEVGSAIKIHTPFVFGGPRMVTELKAAACC
ncbi:MAG: quinone-dependent dihydroorotate dehydrogenase [Minisyncoccia bacterium]